MKDEEIRKGLLRAFSFICILLSLLAVLLFFVCTPYSYAVSQTMVRLDPAFCFASVDQTFILNVTIADVQNLYGLEIDVSWNASVLEIEDVEVKIGQADGVLHNPFYIVENSSTENRYVLAASSMIPASPFNGTGTAARITFQVKDHGNSSLIMSSQLYDYPPSDREPRISLPIEHISQGSIFEEIIPEIGSLPLFAVLTLAAVTIAVLSLTMYTSHRGRRSSGRRLLMSRMNIRV